MKTLRVLTVPTTRTDLICIACGRFTIGRRHLAIVPADCTSDASAHAGVHRACVPLVRRTFTRTKKEKAAS